MTEPTTQSPTTTDWTRPTRTDGLLAGLLAAAAVATWYFILDLVQGQPFFTPAALWSALVLGIDHADDVRITFGSVLGYTVIHFGVWSLIGVVVASILGAARTRPSILLGFVLLAVASVALFIGMISILAFWLVDVLRWWTIGIANILAVGAMVFFIAWRHPFVREALREKSLHEP